MLTRFLSEGKGTQGPGEYLPPPASAYVFGCSWYLLWADLVLEPFSYF